MKIKRIVSLFLALVLALSAVAVLGSCKKSEKGITVQIGPNPETLDPALNNAVDGGNMLITLFETLLIIDQDNKVQPGQAESYTVSPDGLTWTFTMRDGLKWSDGTELNAKDFEYTMKRIADPAVAAPYGETVVGMIEGYQDAIGNPDKNGKKTTKPDIDKLNVKASEDGKTLTIKLAYPCSYFDKIVAFGTMSPVQKATVEKNGDKWALMPADHLALKKLFQTWQEGMQAHDGWNALFWCNHDQPRAVSRFGSDTAYWKESAKMLAAAIHFMRGTPYIYQGEELGMTNAHFTSIDQYRDVESLNYYNILRGEGKSEAETLDIIAQRSRDNGRTPMQWDASANAGFTTGTPWIGTADNYQTINAAAEMDDPDSVRSFYKTLVHLRKQHKVISEGKIEFLFPENADLLAYRRYGAPDGEELLVLCNLTGHEVPVTLPEGWAGAEKLLGNYTETAAALRPYECTVLKK